MILNLVFCIISIILLGFMYSYYKTKNALLKTSLELADVKNQITNLTSTSKMYERLGVDDIKIELGHGLLYIANTQQDGKLLYNITALRQRLTDKLGYVLPEVRVCNSEELGEYEFSIFIHDSKVITQSIYPNRYLTFIEDYEINNQNVPKDNIPCITPSYTEGCWITETDIEYLSKKNIKCVNPNEALTQYLETIAVEYVNDILSIKETDKYIENVRKNYSSSTVDDILAVIPVSTIKQILANLIREKVSIKDIGFIFDKLSEYVRFSQVSYILSERIRAALCQQIISKNTVYNTLFTVSLSESFEKLLDESCQHTEIGMMFFLNPTQIQTLLDSVKMTIKETTEKINRQPVILCSPQIRLPLFQLLVRHLPTITVISYAELTTNIKVENVNVIGKNNTYEELKYME